MFIEFQLSTQLFGRIVRNRIMGLDLCLDNEDHGTVVDRIVPRASSNSTIVQRETKLSTGAVRTEEAASTQLVWVFSPKNYFNFTTRHLQVVQEFDVFLVSASDLETNGVNPTESRRSPFVSRSMYR